ncbi:MAG: sodium/pantothenate symporter [Tissierellia bacterium]|nr:sodium/pantothenate symporter [Tissierellia bacterium]
MSYNFILLTVIVIYMVLNLALGIYLSRRKKRENFIDEYFIGDKTMGGFVLAMTLVATFTSASSFIGGPGIAYQQGLSWVYLSMIQVPTAFFILAILGKRFAIVGRRIQAVTVVDFLKSRYESMGVVFILSFWLIIFSLAQMMSQFIGGAVLLETVTGLPYIVGLTIFGGIVILYTSVGGFKAVVATDTIQGVVMLVGSIIFLITVLYYGGGIDSITAKLDLINPHWKTIDAGGDVPKAYLMSFWILVGVATLGLPQTAVRSMAFRNSKSLHHAMVYGTVLIGALMLIMHISGVFAPAVLDPSEIVSTDYVVPRIILKYLHPVLAGLFIAAPLAAVMSTVSSLLIMTSSSIIKDLYLNYFDKRKISQKKIARGSMITTSVLGIIVFILTIAPPDLIVWINLFALGGMESAFLWGIVLGLYWPGANSTGALLSAILGPLLFIYLSYQEISLWGTNPIILTLIITLIIFVVGSLIGKKTDEKTIKQIFDI